MKVFRNRLTIVIGFIALAMVIATGGVFVAWTSSGYLSAQSGSGDDNDVEVLAAALAITTHASALVADNSAPTHFRMSPESIGVAGVAVANHKAILAQQLEVMEGKGYDDQVEHIRVLTDRLVANTEQIVQGRPPVFQNAVENVLLQQAIQDRGFPLLALINTSADDDLYGLLDSTIKWSSQDDARLYSSKRALEDRVSAVMAHLVATTLLNTPTFLGLAEESYTASSNILRQAIQYLSENESQDLNPEIIEVSNWLLSVGDDGFFEKEAARLRLVSAETNLIADNVLTLDQLLFEIDSLSAVVQGLTPPDAPMQPEEDRGVPGVTDTEIHFGQSAALSGPSAVLGTGMKLGIEAAFAEANESGGVHGRQLRLTTLDDRYESDNAFENTLRLLQVNRVFGLIGAVGTPTSRSAAPVAGAAGAPFVGPFTGANFLRDGELEHVVNYRASYYQETEQMVERLVEDLNVTRVGVLYQNDSYGLDGLEGVRIALESRGLEPVSSGYYRRNTSAIMTAAFQIAEARPEAVIIISSHAPAAEAIKLLRSVLEPDPVFLAVSFVDSQALADDLGEDAGEGVYVTQVAPLPDDRSSEAVRNYRAALSEFDPEAEPGPVSLEGYLVGRMAIEGIQACGPDLTRECFLDAFHGEADISIDEIQLEYGPEDNQGSDTVILTELGEDGDYTQVDEITRGN